MDQKIKQNDRIGENIRKIRKAKGLGQTDLVRMLQIDGCDMSKEHHVKLSVARNTFRSVSSALFAKH